jgi:uncharacterized protein YdaU (DUF1376 family)
MSLNHFPFYPGDYLRDTMGLSLEEDGAYLRLILEYWTRGGPLPSGEASLARIIRVPIKTIRRLSPVLSRFFDRSSPSEWRHKRVEKELLKARLKVDAGREGGIKSTMVRQAKIQAKTQANDQAKSKQNAKQNFPPEPEPESNLNLSTRMPRASPRPLERRASAQIEAKKARGPPRKGNGDAAVPALDEAKLAAYRDQPVQISAAAMQIFGARVPKET